MADRRIVITGARGRLGRELGNLLPEAIHPPRRVDVRDPEPWRTAWIPEGALLIHCAAVLSAQAEREPLLAWAVNVEGTRNVARAAAQRCCRMVYISSDYVFGGESAASPWFPLAPQAGFREDSDASPVNFYGRTKREGEGIALESPNNLVLRAPFRYGPPWPYDNAFDDQWTSARWIGEVAPDIAEAALSELTGVLHIGGPRRNLHEFAESAGVPLRRSKRADWPGLNIPMDTSLDSSRWQAWKAAQVRELVAK